MKVFGKVLLIGVLVLGGLIVMNIDILKIYVDGVSEFCCYICGFSEMLNGFII